MWDLSFTLKSYGVGVRGGAHWELFRGYPVYLCLMWQMVVVTGESEPEPELDNKFLKSFLK